MVEEGKLLFRGEESGVTYAADEEFGVRQLETLSTRVLLDAEDEMVGVCASASRAR